VIGTQGCARPLSTVSGRVYLQGQPVTAGSVVFYCEGQVIVRGQIGSDGAYSIPNVPRGDVRIAVVPPARLPEPFRRQLATPPIHDGPVSPEFVPSMKFDKSQAIPKRFSMPEESGLVLNVDRRATEFDIQLAR